MPLKSPHAQQIDYVSAAAKFRERQFSQFERAPGATQRAFVPLRLSLPVPLRPQQSDTRLDSESACARRSLRRLLHLRLQGPRANRSHRWSCPPLNQIAAPAILLVNSPTNLPPMTAPVPPPMPLPIRLNLHRPQTYPRNRRGPAIHRTGEAD
jgi:hypothetical protein